MPLSVCVSVLQAVSELMFNESPDEVGDLYLDVAEAYMEMGVYAEARRYLALLVEANNYTSFVSTP